MSRDDPPPSSGDPILVRYHWGPDAMVVALATHQRVSRWRRLRFLVLLLLAIIYFPMTVMLPLGVVYKDGIGSPAGRMSLGTAAGFLCLWVWLAVAIRRRSLLRWQARRAFRSTAIGPHLVDWEISDDELISRTPMTAATIHWTLFVKAVESAQGFLLYQSSMFFNWLPSDGFASEADLRRFGGMVREHVADFRELAPARFVGKPDASEFGDL